MSQTIAPVSRTRRWPLYVSLFLNVVLITVIVIGGWKIRQAREAFGGLGPWMPNQIEKVLPRDAAEKVKRIKAAHADEFRPLFVAMRTTREAVRRQLDAEPFDAVALKATLLKMHEADAAIAGATANVVVEIAAELSPAERALVREKARDFRNGPRGRDGAGPSRRQGEPPIGIPPKEMREAPPQPPVKTTPAPTP